MLLKCSAKGKQEVALKKTDYRLAVVRRFVAVCFALGRAVRFDFATVLCLVDAAPDLRAVDLRLPDAPADLRVLLLALFFDTPDELVFFFAPGSFKCCAL